MNKYRTMYQETQETYQDSERDPLAPGRVVTSGSLFATHRGTIKEVLGNGKFIVLWCKRTKRARSRYQGYSTRRNPIDFITHCDTLDAVNAVYA